MTFRPISRGDISVITDVNEDLYLLNAAAHNFLNMIAYTLAEKPTFHVIGHYEKVGDNRLEWRGNYVSKEMIDQVRKEMEGFLLAWANIQPGGKEET